MTAWIRRLSTSGELILINALCFGWSIQSSILWLRIGPHAIPLTSSGALRLIALEICSMVAAGAVLRIRGWNLRRLGFARGWIPFVTGGAFYYLYFWSWLLVGGLLSMIPAVADVFSSAPHFTHPAAWPILLILVLINPLSEETFVAAYNIEALRDRGPVIAILVSTTIRVSYHLYQGPSAIITIGFFGLFLATIYWRFRSTWMIVVMHAISNAISFMHG